MGQVAGSARFASESPRITIVSIDYERSRNLGAEYDLPLSQCRKFWDFGWGGGWRFGGDLIDQWIESLMPVQSNGRMITIGRRTTQAVQAEPQPLS
jgi:hypothetical protein